MGNFIPGIGHCPAPVNAKFAGMNYTDSCGTITFRSKYCRNHTCSENQCKNMSIHNGLCQVHCTLPCTECKSVYPEHGKTLCTACIIKYGNVEKST